MLKNFSILIICTLLNTSLYAEVITDGTVGRATPLSGPDFLIGNDLGQQRGSNLFHSFRTFNINTKESATFTGPDSISNIISRVTGGSQSFIDGKLISDIEGANLYLLNPKGILFGENASLNITGSFHASTADVLHLEDGGYFTVGNPNNSLLTVAPPSAFGFLNSNPSPITIEGSSIEVFDEQEISLIGGNLNIMDGILFAPSGRINLASVASKGKVIPTNSDLVMEEFEKQGNINITSSKNFSYFYEDGEPLPNVNVSGYGGQIFIRGGQFVLDNARMYAHTDGYESGRIDIAIDGDMHVTNSSEIAAYNFGDGQGTFVDITANELRLDGVNVGEWREILSTINIDDIDYYIERYLEGREISVSNEEFVKLEKGTTFLVDSVKEILSKIDNDENISFDAVLDKINIDENNKNVTDILADILVDITIFELGNAITIGNISAEPQATGGNIKINTSSLIIDTGIIQVVTEGPGKAGNIEIDAKQVELPALGFINATTGFNFEEPIVEKEDGGGFGQGGNIIINTTNEISVDNFSSITVGADVETSGKAGNIYLNAPRLTLDNGQITSYSSGTGNAGEIKITANTVLLDYDSSIITEADLAGGGNISIQAIDSLELFNDSLISAEAFGKNPQDKGGNLTINAPNILALDNSDLFANAYAGNGGKIDITASDFRIYGNSQIDVSSVLGFTGEFWLNKVKLRDDFLTLSPQKFQHADLSLNRCTLSTEELTSSFYIITRDTLPTSPTDLKTHLYFPQ